MSAQNWVSRFNSWYSWVNSSAGPYHNGGVSWPYHLKNFSVAQNTDYATSSAKMVTLSEGQSYGMMYALLADDIKAFGRVYAVLKDKHLLTRANITASKNVQVNGSPGWAEGWMNFLDNTGRFVLDAKGANAALNLYGWVWSEEYASGKQGIGSIYQATDGDLFTAACLLMAYERWGVPEWLADAKSVLTDIAQYSVRYAASRPVWHMGQYRGSNGFTMPAYQELALGAGIVNTTANTIALSTSYMTTGDQVRFWILGGSALPSPLVAQDALGEVWPAYYLRVTATGFIALYPTFSDANADTNRIDLTTTGSGTGYAYLYKQQSGFIATNPSYLIAPFFKLFAKYDTTNASLWNALATQSYTDIEFSRTLNAFTMPAYLVGVNIGDASKSQYLYGANTAKHSLDAVRVALNLALDPSNDALNQLKAHATFNNTTQRWEPKSGLAGGIWGFYRDSGFIPSMFDAAAVIGAFTSSDVDTTNNRIDLKVDWLADAGHTYTTPIWIDAPSNALNMPAVNGSYTYMYQKGVYPRLVSGTTYTLHGSRAEALSGANPLDITSTGSGDLAWYPLYVVSSIDTYNNVIYMANERQIGGTGTSAYHFMPSVVGALPSALASSPTLFPRLQNRYSATLYTSSAAAIAGTTAPYSLAGSAGSGEVLVYHPRPTLDWHYRTSVGETTEMSPYGAAQILAYEYRLNGYAAAETFYNSLPSWLKQQGDGSFVESDPDYYVQHALAWITGILSGRAPARLVGRQYLIFASDALVAANTAATQIGQALGITAYATVLYNIDTGQYAVPVIGSGAWAALSADQQSATVKVLPAGRWRANT